MNLSQLKSSLAVWWLFADFFALVTGLFPTVLRFFEHKNNDELCVLQLEWEDENASSLKTIEIVVALVWAVASTKNRVTERKWLLTEGELIRIHSPLLQPKDHNYARQLRWDSNGRSVSARGGSLARPWALRSYGSYGSWATMWWTPPALKHDNMTESWDGHPATLEASKEKSRNKSQGRAHRNGALTCSLQVCQVDQGCTCLRSIINGLTIGQTLQGNPGEGLTVVWRSGAACLLVYLKQTSYACTLDR